MLHFYFNIARLLIICLSAMQKTHLGYESWRRLSCKNGAEMKYRLSRWSYNYYLQFKRINDNFLNHPWSAIFQLKVVTDRSFLVITKEFWLPFSPFSCGSLFLSRDQIYSRMSPMLKLICCRSYVTVQVTVSSRIVIYWGLDCECYR